MEQGERVKYVRTQYRSEYVSSEYVESKYDWNLRFVSDPSPSQIVSKQLPLPNPYSVIHNQ